jgi:hypothetical protein
LDWLSAVRVHPVNDVVSKLVPAVLLACLGFPFQVLAGYLAVLTFYTIVLHANVDWSYGPLRHIIASPVFHRWHHTTEEQGLNRNFAPLFPFIDLLFGTFLMPHRVRPERFGAAPIPIPARQAVRSDFAGIPALDAPVARSFLDAEARNVRAWIQQLDIPRCVPACDAPSVSRKRRAKKPVRVPVQTD